METHHITPARGLSETGLKWIALVTMVLDHIHYFFSFTGCVPEWFSMVGRLGAPLFLFCLVEGFTHTHSRKRYFARVYVLSTAMSLLFFFMAFAHVLVRPDGFYPANGMMTTFVILMVMFQGIDWLGRRHIVRGLAALLLPLAWPFLASALSLAVPALATPVGLAAYSVLPAWGTTGDSSWPVLAMGLVLYLFRRNRRGQVLAFAVFYFLYGVVYMGLMVSLLDRGGAVSEAHCRWADCILLDVMMPGEDGFATCRRIRALAAHPAQTFTKEQIYEAVFGFDGTADSSAITEHIKNIRAKLRAVGLSPIQTVWGVGYKWESA